MSQEIELLNKGIHICKEIIDLLEKREDRNVGFKQIVTKNDFSPLPLRYEKKWFLLNDIHHGCTERQSYLVFFSSFTKKFKLCI